MQYYSAIKYKEILYFATKTNVTERCYLSKINQLPAQDYVIIYVRL